ncbi:MAG TPA: SRPBCC family protein [Chthoniobacterales bacterium]|nr:SRPBCC family protein [Chthoniobacterales bacterium]
MKILLIVVGAFVALVGLVLLIGAMLPRKHVASREITLRRSPAAVYAAVRDVASAPSWRTDLNAIETLESVEGRHRFREKSSNGLITYEVVEEVANEKLVTRIVDRDLGYFGSWIYEFLPNESGTRIRITENGEVPNVLFRFASRFVFGHTATMDSYLRALGRKFGEDTMAK